ncbi:MAG: hypothetical protein ACLPQY_31475 [Streptosporangiaceae bacterium]
MTVPPLSQVADPTSAADLAAQLAKQAPHLVSYVIAFYIIAQFWLTPPPGLPPRGRPPGQPGVVELRVPGHHHDHAVTSSLLGEYPSNRNSPARCSSSAAGPSPRTSSQRLRCAIKWI